MSLISKKYFIIWLAAFVLEIASTMYIKNVSDRSAAMIFWAAASPWLTLPFVGYMIESKNWKERVLMAISQSSGYSAGALLIYLTK